ncbi:MAG: PHP domain-containing protein [Clostridia bacterium]|nr:PHP domain-containing protein [Clostridia bacterium]
MGYKYELHLHTSEASKCGSATAAEQVALYHSMGYAGICITNHFFRGNTSIPVDLPFEEQIRYYVRAYELAKEAAEGTDLDVFLGWEYAMGGGSEFLILGLDTDWLLAHPDQMQWRPAEYFDRVRADGGFVIQAHPYRQASYIDTIRLMPWHVDGVEVCNAGNSDFDNNMAEHYARMYGLPMYAGSDNHGSHPKRLAGVEADRRYGNITDMLRAAASHPEWLFDKTYEEMIGTKG